MKKFMVLLLSVSCVGLYKTTNAALISNENNGTLAFNSGTTDKTVIELNKDITVNTGLNLDQVLAELNGTESSNVPKVRKVTKVGYEKTNASAVVSSKLPNILTDAVVVDIKVPDNNTTIKVTSEVEEENDNKIKKVSSPDNQKRISSNKTEADVNSNKIYKKSNSTIIVTPKPQEAANKNGKAEIAQSSLEIRKKIEVNVTSTIAPQSILANSKINSISTAGGINNATTANTTTTTTTPKPKKPTVTYSIPDFPDLENDNPDLKNLLKSPSSAFGKLSITDGPYAQPSQEFNNSSFHRGRDFILPIVSMIFIIPLVIGILITSYRRFRDCWSTRHYRRMDFLVDGMYND